MADRPDEGFLPPQPPGPEPELGEAPRPTPPAPEPGPPAQQAPPAQWGQPPPAQWGQPPPGAWQSQQGWEQQPPLQQPPQQGWQQPQWAYPREPDNGPAVTGFVLAMVSIGLWLLSAGLSTLISLGLAIAGLFVSRTGKRRVASGQTRKHRGLAQAGFISSIVMIVLATLSTIAWTLFIVLLATDDEFRRDFENDDDGFGSDAITTMVRVGVLAMRVGTHLLS